MNDFSTWAAAMSWLFIPGAALSLCDGRVQAPGRTRPWLGTLDEFIAVRDAAAYEARTTLPPRLWRALVARHGQGADRDAARREMARSAVADCEATDQLCKAMAAAWGSYALTVLEAHRPIGLATA